MSGSSGPFEILEVLGDGAFGAVYVARRADDPLKRLVAIKVLKAEYATNPKVLHRTRDEARLLSKLHHPNIVRIEQLVELGGRPVLVMELVQGVSLKRLLVRANDGVPPSVAMECMRQTCVALHAAYNQAVGDDGRPMRVIHRDIKPSNMLLSIHGQLKVVDFGIATGQFREREAHTESVVMGSRPYMAPERLDGRADTPAVDIYSAGISLLELLTGRTVNLSVKPAEHERSLQEAVHHIRPEGMTPAAAEELRQLVRRMVAYEAAQRPAALTVAQSLRHLIDGMDPAHHVGLEAYAREAVEPIFLGRRRGSIAEAMQNLPAGELITGVFHPPAADARVARARPLGRRPALFLGAVVGALGALGWLAWAKSGASKPPRAQEPEPALAEIYVWMPADARARVGATIAAMPGKIWVSAGSSTLELLFEGGEVLLCPFEAKPGRSVRYVVERGRGAISIDDGPALPCKGAPP